MTGRDTGTGTGTQAHAQTQALAQAQAQTRSRLAGCKGGKVAVDGMVDVVQLHAGPVWAHQQLEMG